jgi:hypothetical protein
MPNVISGHISGNYGGPRSCDTAYGASRSATSCASNTGDCSHTVVVGSTGLTASYLPLNTIYPDNINIYKGQSYTGPAGCTFGNNCRYTSCNDAESYVQGAFYVNPGECVELLFTFYSRAYNDDTIFCLPVLDLTISGATAPNLGVLSGSWYGSTAVLNNCCSQLNAGRICEPDLYSPIPSNPSFNYHRAYLTYEMFRNDMLSHLSSFSSFCCPARTGCGAGTQSVRATYDSIYTSCIYSYARECYYQSGPGCIGGTGSATHTVIADIVGPYTASYIYCADQPCGARIEFAPRASSLSTIGNIRAQADFDAWLQITGSTGCGTGC